MDEKTSPYTLLFDVRETKLLLLPTLLNRAVSVFIVAFVEVDCGPAVGDHAPVVLVQVPFAFCQV